MQSVARVPKSNDVRNVIKFTSLKRTAHAKPQPTRGRTAAEFVKAFFADPGFGKPSFSKRCVELSTVASAYVPSPKNTLLSVFQNLRQAARAKVSMCIAGRLAGPSQSQRSRGVLPVAAVASVQSVALRKASGHRLH